MTSVLLSFLWLLFINFETDRIKSPKYFHRDPLKGPIAVLSHHVKAQQASSVRDLTRLIIVVHKNNGYSAPCNTIKGFDKEMPIPKEL